MSKISDDAMMAIDRFDAACQEWSFQSDHVGDRLEEARKEYADAKDHIILSFSSGWSPIDEAPKDGTIVDLWHEEFGRQADMYWGKPQHCCGEYGKYCDSDWHSEPEGWVFSSLNQVIFEDGYTHWMPIPTAPEVPQ